MPASLTQVSKPPKRCTALSAMACTSSRRPTSATTWVASPPAASISSWIVASASALREASTTRAPARAAMRAVASPMPLEPPVMTITCSPRGLCAWLMESSVQDGGIQALTMTGVLRSFGRAAAGPSQTPNLRHDPEQAIGQDVTAPP